MCTALNVGIIGCGNIAARAHLPAWDECRDLAQIVAVADPSKDARTRVGDLAGLDDADRRHNLRIAYRAREAVAANHVLIVDDVITTGETCARLAAVAIAAGAKKVSALAVARA